MTKRRAGHLDNRNLGQRVAIEREAHTFYGIIASIDQYEPDDDKPATTVIAFTDGTEFILSKQHTVDTTITGWELTIMDLHKLALKVARRSGLLEEPSYTREQSQEIMDHGGGS